jgi:hypothetical protein
LKTFSVACVPAAVETAAGTRSPGRLDVARDDRRVRLRAVFRPALCDSRVAEGEHDLARLRVLADQHANVEDPLRPAGIQVVQHPVGRTLHHDRRRRSVLEEPQPGRKAQVDLRDPDLPERRLRLVGDVVDPSALQNVGEVAPREQHAVLRRRCLLGVLRAGSGRQSAKHHSRQRRRQQLQPSCHRASLAPWNSKGESRKEWGLNPLGNSSITRKM